MLLLILMICVAYSATSPNNLLNSRFIGHECRDQQTCHINGQNDFCCPFGKICCNRNVQSWQSCCDPERQVCGEGTPVVPRVPDFLISKTKMCVPKEDCPEKQKCADYCCKSTEACVHMCFYGRCSGKVCSGSLIPQAIKFKMGQILEKPDEGNEIEEIPTNNKKLDTLDILGVKM